MKEPWDDKYMGAVKRKIHVEEEEPEVKSRKQEEATSSDDPLGSKEASDQGGLKDDANEEMKEREEDEMTRWMETN